MSDIEKNDTEFDEMDEDVVVMTDEAGNEYYYHEELIIPIGEKRYAILVPLEGGCGCGCEGEGEGEGEGCDCTECGDDEDEVDVLIARIDIDEDGEEVYLDPTEEEFEQVRQAYEKLMEEEEE